MRENKWERTKNKLNQQWRNEKKKNEIERDGRKMQGYR